MASSANVERDPVPRSDDAPSDFIRQIIAELRKVVRPSRSELWTFFLVVIVFVLAIMVFVGVLDFLFGQLVFFVLGS
jgi:preprotein translocase subunit SecE